VIIFLSQTNKKVTQVAERPWVSYATRSAADIARKLRNSRRATTMPGPRISPAWTKPSYRPHHTFALRGFESHRSLVAQEYGCYFKMKVEHRALTRDSITLRKL
jgi:hypothetical protein